MDHGKTFYVLDVDDVLAARLRGERERTPVGRKRALRVDVAQLFELGIERARREPFETLAGGGVGEVEIEEDFGAQQVAGGDVGDLPSVEENAGATYTGMMPPVRFALSSSCATPRSVEAGDGGQVRRLHRLLPLVAELGEIEARVTLEGAVGAERRRRGENLADDFVAPPLADETPERLAVTVREEHIRALGHLLHRRQISVERGVADDRIGRGVVEADREIFGHSLHVPRRRTVLYECLEPAARMAACVDVELELVDHLVRHHVLGLREIHLEEERVPLVDRIGDAAHALTEIAEDIALREIAA